VDELNTAINDYWTKWQALVATCTNQAFFNDLMPTAIGWKTENLTEFDQRFVALRDLSDQIHLGWINERWVATFHLRGDALAQGITIVKLMQRRPGSTDAIGLDHVDFYVNPAIAPAVEMVSAEPNLKWSEEHNGDCSKWISVWFADTEAKLRSDTVVEVCIQEMEAIDKAVLDGVVPSNDNTSKGGSALGLAANPAAPVPNVAPETDIE